MTALLECLMKGLMNNLFLAVRNNDCYAQGFCSIRKRHYTDRNFKLIHMEQCCGKNTFQEDSCD